MATQDSGGDHLAFPSERRRRSRKQRSRRSGTVVKSLVKQWKSANRPPRPNHFLSVRIDSAPIWQEVSSLQEHIVESHRHLQPAAIPVQDLHVTLFVLRLEKEDGSLQRAVETLKDCSDILLELGLSPRDPDPLAFSEPQGSPAQSTSASRDKGPSTDAGEVEDVPIAGTQVCGAVDCSELQNPNPEAVEGTTNAQKEPASLHNAVHILSAGDEERCAGEPLKLSFRGLGSFDDTVLYACLDENEQSDRLRRLVHALHKRFSDAALFDAPSPGEGGETAPDGVEREEGSSHFDFKPHLTVMKTSKLKKRGIKILPAYYESSRDMVFGSHSPVAVELSSMLEREEASAAGAWEPLPYYKCVEKLVLASPITAALLACASLGNPTS